MGKKRLYHLIELSTYSLVNGEVEYRKWLKYKWLTVVEIQSSNSVINRFTTSTNLAFFGLVIL